MPVNEKLGRKIALKLEDGGSDVTVGDVVSADLSVESSLVDIINDSSGAWTERIKSRGDWSISLSVHLTEDDSSSNQSLLAEAAFSEDGVVTFKLEPETPATGDVSYSGEAIVSSYSISKETDSIVKASFKLQGNGELVRSVSAA